MICFKLWDLRALLLAFSFWVVLSHFSVICTPWMMCFEIEIYSLFFSFLFFFNCIYFLNVILCVLGVFHIVICFGKWNKDWWEIFSLTLLFFFSLCLSLGYLPCDLNVWGFQCCFLFIDFHSLVCFHFLILYWLY